FLPVAIASCPAALVLFLSFFFTLPPPPRFSPFPFPALFRSAARDRWRRGACLGQRRMVGRHRRRCPRFAAAAGRVVIPSAALEGSEEHTSELQSQSNLVCRLLLEKKKKKNNKKDSHSSKNQR